MITMDYKALQISNLLITKGNSAYIFAGETDLTDLIKSSFPLAMCMYELSVYVF